MSTPIEDIEQEKDEVLLCVEPDTIVDPWAMVIHPCNTSLADRAVMGVRRFDRVALLALLRHNLVEEPHISSIHHYRALVRTFQRLTVLLSVDLGVDTFHDGFKCLALLLLDVVLGSTTSNIYFANIIYYQSQLGGYLCLPFAMSATVACVVLLLIVALSSSLMSAF